MRAITQQQIEVIRQLGGTILNDYITFEVDNQVWGEHCEAEKTLWDEMQNIFPQIDGAVQGHPFDEGDMNYLYFKIDFIPDPKDYLNWAELSRTLAKDRSSITRDRIPDKHKEKIDMLLDDIRCWLLS